MTKSAPSGFSRLLLIGLTVLALIASVLMLFLNSDAWLKIAVIAALWAAFLGIVLVTKYSAALNAERQRNDMLAANHQAELRQEEADHRQREAEIERSYQEKLQSQRDEHLEQLRQEILSLRAQLSELSGEHFEPEQTSVHARAERVRELPGFSTGSFAAVQWAGQDTEETTQIPLIVDNPVDNPEETEHHGRRRADESTSGLTVAELMKRFREKRN